MKKSTIAIISVVCTFIICTGIFGLYISFSNDDSKENETSEKVEQIQQFEKTARIFISCDTAGNKKILSDDIVASSMSRDTYAMILQSDIVKKEIEAKYPGVKFETELKNIDDTEVFEITVKCDNENFTTGICNLLADEFCNAVRNITTADCEVIEYAN